MADELAEVDVRSVTQTPTSLADLQELIGQFVSHATEVESFICSKLSRTTYDGIKASDVYKKGEAKVTRSFLFDTCDKFLSLSNALSKYSCNPENSHNIENLLSLNVTKSAAMESSNTLNLTKVADYVNVQIKVMDTRLQNLNSDLNNNTKVLSDLLASIKPEKLKDTSEESQVMKPNTASPRLSPSISQPPCDPYSKYVDNVIPPDMRDNLLGFTKNQSFDCHDAFDSIYFGEFGLHSSNLKYEAKPMPAPIVELLQHIRSVLPNPETTLNSCLITRYQNGSKFSSQHSELEPVIDPESNIIKVIISEGSPRKISFRPKADLSAASIDKVLDLDLKDSSVCIFSRYSQDFWTHGIERNEAASGCLYSFTFRNISPYFLNSTIVIGDCNTTRLQFGPDRGQFGRWMPGKQVTAYRVEDIPSPTKIGPYRNIVLHTGINNLKSQNRRSRKSLIDEIETKCENIFSVYP